MMKGNIVLLRFMEPCLLSVSDFVEGLIIIHLVMAWPSRRRRRKGGGLMRSLRICALQSAFDWCSHIRSALIFPSWIH